MIEQKYSDIVTPKLLVGAIENNEYDGFLHDYHVLHCLIRKYKPKTFFEIGTNMGTGTNIICNAVRSYMIDLVSPIRVYSLDLPTELAHISLQHPISEGKGDKVGERCKFTYTQLRGDSLTFDFSQYPCEGYFIDGEHDFEHPKKESWECLKLKPKIIIWHDADIYDVWRGINVAVYDKGFSLSYDLYRVTDTRIAYVVRKANPVYYPNPHEAALKMIEYYNDNPSSKPVMISNDEAAKKCKMKIELFNKEIAKIKKELFLKVGTNYSIFIDCDRIAYSY